MTDERPAPARIRVWDLLIRCGHWLLVSTVIIAWLTHETGGSWHEWFGYGALAIVVIRLAWGFLGTTYARFTQFVRPLQHTLAYSLDVVKGRARRYLGHNPLGGYMIVALLADLLVVCLSGWLYVTDRFWGVEWVEELHDISANILLLLVIAHIAGVIFTSKKEQENLVLAMLHGHKRAPQGDDVA